MSMLIVKVNYTIKFKIDQFYQLIFKIDETQSTEVVEPKQSHKVASELEISETEIVVDVINFVSDEPAAEKLMKEVAAEKLMKEVAAIETPSRRRGVRINYSELATGSPAKSSHRARSASTESQNKEKEKNKTKTANKMETITETAGSSKSKEKIAVVKTNEDQTTQIEEPMAKESKTKSSKTKNALAVDVEEVSATPKRVRRAVTPFTGESSIEPGNSYNFKPINNNF